MLKRISKKKLTGVVIAGIITVTCATTAFAADIPVHMRPINHKQFFMADKTKIDDAVKSAVDSLVKAGTITQAQADAALNAYTPEKGKGAPVFVKKNPMSELVTAGTITQAQADAVLEAVKPVREPAAVVKEALDKLVTSGTITQAQADAITKVFPYRAGKMFEKGDKKGYLDKLVSEGTITQAQADSINAAMKSGRENRTTIEETFKNLVSNSTITQAQADAVLKSCKPLEKKEFRMEHKRNPLGELVTAGTLTQTQADAINSAVKASMDSLKK